MTLYLPIPNTSLSDLNYGLHFVIKIHLVLVNIRIFLEKQKIKSTILMLYQKIIIKRNYVLLCLFNI